MKVVMFSTKPGIRVAAPVKVPANGYAVVQIESSQSGTDGFLYAYICMLKIKHQLFIQKTKLKTFNN